MVLLPDSTGERFDIIRPYGQMYKNGLSLHNVTMELQDKL